MSDEKENVSEEVKEEAAVTEPAVSNDTETEKVETEKAETEKAETEKAETEKTEIEKTEDGKGKKSTAWILPVATVLAVAIIILALILMLPANRSEYLRKAGDRAIAAEKYEKAYKYYSKAAEVLYYNMDAQLGRVLAAETSKEVDEYEAYSLVLADVNRLVPEQIDDTNRKNILEIYLAAPDIVDDSEELVAVLTKGYELTGNSGELVNALCDACVAAGDSLYATDRTKAAEYYDKALVYGNNAEAVCSKVAKAVSYWIEDDILVDNYEASEGLLDKYGEILGKEKDELSAKMTSAQTFYNAKVSVLSKAYELMSPYYEKWKDDFSIDERNSISSIDFGMFAYNWDEMLRLDGSEDAELVARSGKSDKYLYASERVTDNYTGPVCGLYLYDDGLSYCFFMGNLVNGKREGYGYCIAKVDSTSYYGFEGMWKDDKPNGAGVFYKNNRYSYTSLVKYCFVTIGTYKDGLEDGLMTVKATTNENPGSFFIGRYTAKEGIAEPITATTEEYETTVYEDRYLICTMVDTVYGYGYYMPYFQYKDAKMTAMGYE